MTFDSEPLQNTSTHHNMFAFSMLVIALLSSFTSDNVQAYILRSRHHGTCLSSSGRRESCSCALFSSSPRRATAYAVLAGLSGPFAIIDPTLLLHHDIPFIVSTSSIAHADSTGKMSTKLTAKKRYLPRIKTGLSLFNQLLQQPTKTGIDSFITDELPNLRRAMSLYGASLRKGEVPDEISRKAESLTDAFVREVNKLESSKEVATQLQQADLALKEYLQFAKIEDP